jgi:hypothetical protein
VLYTGNGFATAGTQTISGVGFQPDFVWIKSRSAASSNHSLYDAVRTAGNTLVSNSTAAETSQTDSLTAFTSDGFSLGDNSESGANVNVNTATYVAWNWYTGGSNATNEDGTITSTVRANPTAGFSIISWTATGTGSTQTVGHGLGVTPKMVIVRSRTDGVSYYNWTVYHSSLTANYNLYLNLSLAESATPGSGWLGAPTSSVITLTKGTSGNNNVNSGDMIGYCFAEVEGYSKFGSYTGNGSTDGPFVYCGFRPAFVLIKLSSTSGTSWRIYDNKRNAYNLTNAELYPDLSNAEATNSGAVDFLSNGFKLRTSVNGNNGSTYTYIFMALASNPFKFSLAR